MTWHEKVIFDGVLVNLPWLIRHFSSVDKSAAPDRNMGYLQVPGSIPAEPPRTQIHMDLS